MTTKMIREIEKEEIKEIKTLHVTPLFIISEGKLSNEKILLYKLRCYQYIQGVLENLFHSNNILINLQSKHFLERIGYIHDKVEKSLTFVYKHPTQGHVFSLEHLESENDEERYFKQFIYLEQIFHMVYLIKKRDNTLDVGCCLYPYLYFQYYDSQKNLSLVDCIFTYCFSNVNNNFIRNLCGFFDSNNSDEIAMSCILLAYFFRGSKNFDMIQILNLYVRLNDNDKLADFPFLTNNGQQMIGHPNVQSFIALVIKKKEKEKELYRYQNFYDDFKAFAEEEKKNLEGKINHNKKDKDMFYMALKEKTDLFNEFLTRKEELEVLYSYLPQNTPMQLSKKIEDEIVNETSKKIKIKDESKDKIKKVIEEKLKPQIEEINKKIKPYFLDKINQLKVQNAPLSEIEKVGKELEEVTKLINDMNAYYKDYSILLQIDSEGNDFLTKLELTKNKLLPPLFIENSKAIINFPKTLTLENEINYLKQKPNFPSIESNDIFTYVNQGNDTIELFYQSMEAGSIQTKSKTIECEFEEKSCGKINRFPHECKWLTFKSFIFVTGGEDVDSDADINLVIDLTKENRAIVLVKPPMQNRRKYHSMCKVNDFSFVVCGGTSNTAELFSVLTSKWTSLPNLNINRENGILLLFNKIDLYYFGGKEQSNIIEKYSLGSEGKEFWDKIVLNQGISISKGGYFPFEKRADLDVIILGGKSDDEYNGKTYLLSLKDNTIEEFNSKITFTITYEFEESRMKCVNDKSLMQVGVDEKGNRNLVSFDEGMFNL